MSNGDNYGFDWQTPVGWLEDQVPLGQVATVNLTSVAKKLAFYIGQTRYYLEENSTEADIPGDAFYQMDGARGTHICEIGSCQQSMSGVYGFRKWKFPTGIVHYILDHSWQPPVAFLRELEELAEPPEVVAVASYQAPNIKKMFHREKSVMR